MGRFIGPENSKTQGIKGFGYELKGMNPFRPDKKALWALLAVSVSGHLLAFSFPFWVAAPVRSNPHDPRSPQFRSQAALPPTTATPAVTQTPALTATPSPTVTAAAASFTPTPSTVCGIITTVAGSGVSGTAGDGGPATAAQLDFPFAIAFDKSGNYYIADYKNDRIQKVDTTGIMTTVVGDGSFFAAPHTSEMIGDGGFATAASVWEPDGVAVDNAGNLYISDGANNRIRKVDNSGTISSFAGTGQPGDTGDGGLATAAAVFYPSGVAVDNAGNVYFTEANGARVRKVDSSGIISTIAGNGGPNPAVQLNLPYGIGVDSQGNVYFCDTNNNRVLKVNGAGIITTIAGTGIAGNSGDGGPWPRLPKLAIRWESWQTVLVIFISQTLTTSERWTYRALLARWLEP